MAIHGTPSQAAIDRRLKRASHTPGGMGDYDDSTDDSMLKNNPKSIMNKDAAQTSEIFNRLRHIRKINPSQGRTSLPTAGFKQKKRKVASGFNPSTISRRAGAAGLKGGNW